jgi:hypothetical protein
MTTEEVWKRANEIRKNQLGPDTRELKLKTWKAEFSKSLKRAEDPEHWLGIWEMYWTHPAFAWWRNTPQLPHAADEAQGSVGAGAGDKHQQTEHRHPWLGQDLVA